uniref:Integrin beta-like protein 1 n=1 Tax=Romanomermis culicivorax TaxID=13658 RepID=A0A915HMP9_ROMCU
MFIWLVSLALIFFLTADSTPVCPHETTNERCSTCINSNLCAWCKAKNFASGGNSSRCDTYERLLERGCPIDMIEHSKLNNTTTASRSERCHFHGIWACDGCHCDEGFIGKYCECQIDSTTNTTAEMDKLCMINEDTTQPLCSGNGVCVCGRCQCMRRPNAKEIFYGRFCECDNFNCPRSRRLICSDHGHCDCGTCICEIGWKGPACELPDH